MYLPSHQLSKTSDWLTFPSGGLWRARGSSAETHNSLLEDEAVVNNNKDNADMLDAQSQQEEKPAGSQAARWRDTSRSSVPVSVEKKQHGIHQPIAAGFDQVTLFFSLSSKKKCPFKFKKPDKRLLVYFCILNY